jgi:hypothetical protein
LSMIVAGRLGRDVWSTRVRAFTDVSPELVGSTAANDLLYTTGTVASAAIRYQFIIQYQRLFLSHLSLN